MKKLMTVLLTMVLVFGFSAMVMADGHEFGDAQLEVGIEIQPYGEFGIVTDFFTNKDGETILSGLFNDMDITLPGLYISDGGATENAALSHFNTVLGSGLTGAINADDVDNNNVEMLVVAANVDTVLSMSSDFDFGPDWNNAEVMFRFSSSENIDDLHDDSEFLPAFTVGDYSPYTDVDNYNIDRWALEDYTNNNELIVRGSLTQNTMAVLDTAEGMTGGSWQAQPDSNEWPFISSLNIMGEGDMDLAEITIPFRECTPTLVHINGALLLEKATSMPAGEYSTILDFTLAAAPDMD